MNNKESVDMAVVTLYGTMTFIEIIIISVLMWFKILTGIFGSFAIIVGIFLGGIVGFTLSFVLVEIMFTNITYNRGPVTNTIDEYII